MELIIEPLTKEKLQENIEQLFILENNWTELGEIPWNKENFNKELPGKWKLSVIALMDDKIIGYAIASFENRIAKLNKILVDRSFRRIGIATKLWESILKKSREVGVDRLEFKVLKENLSAIEFYKNKKAVINGVSIGTDGKERYDVKYIFKTKRIRHSRPTIGEIEADAAFEVIKSGNIATHENVNEFVRLFSKFIGKRFGAATNNGVSALHLALKALDVKSGDEVIIPSYVCGAILNAVNYCKATPVITDINEDYNISLNDVKKKITKKTKAIILPHMFGKPSKDTEEFMKLGIPIIEDCALSVGAMHNKGKAGSFGDISVFSFYATKVMTTGTGGMLLTDNEKIIEKVNDLLKYDNREEFDESYNYTMNDIQAALGIVQLERLNDFIDKRKKIAETYSSLLKDIKLPDSEENIFFRYIIRTENAEELIENLKKRGIDSLKPVFIPLHRYLNLSDEDFPNTSMLYKQSVSIPIYPSLTYEEIEDISGAIINWKIEGGKDEL